MCTRIRSYYWSLYVVLSCIILIYYYYQETTKTHMMRFFGEETETRGVEASLCSLCSRSIVMPPRSIAPAAHLGPRSKTRLAASAMHFPSMHGDDAVAMLLAPRSCNAIPVLHCGQIRNSWLVPYAAIHRRSIRSAVLQRAESSSIGRLHDFVHGQSRRVWTKRASQVDVSSFGLTMQNPRGNPAGAASET